MLPSILLVDDDSTTNFLNKRLLQQLNICQEVLVALNGQRALDVLEKHCQPDSDTCPSLVLLDVNMPVMNGFEFLETYVRNSEHRHPIVFIMLTSSELDQDLVRAQHLPVTDFLNKPLTREKIMNVLSCYFE